MTTTPRAAVTAVFILGGLAAGAAVLGPPPQGYRIRRGAIALMASCTLYGFVSGWLVGRK